MRLTKPLTFLPAFLFMVACAYGLDTLYNYDSGNMKTFASMRNARIECYVCCWELGSGSSQGDLKCSSLLKERICHKYQDDLYVS